MGAKVRKYSSNVTTWLSFCSGTSHCLEFSTTSNRIDHAGPDNLPRLVGMPSEIFPKYGNDVEREKTITNSWFATT